MSTPELLFCPNAQAPDGTLATGTAAGGRRGDGRDTEVLEVMLDRDGVHPVSAMLSAEEVSRYARHLTLPDVGVEGQRRLKTARVLCVGAGGLGSPALMYLAAAGVGRLGIVDFDLVDESNLQRQILHSTSGVGRPKVVSAAERLHDLNPFVQIDVIQERLGRDNALEILGPYDVVIDGSDNFTTRYLVNDACVLLGKPLVYGAISRFAGQVAVFNHRGGPNYRDLYPEPPPPEQAPSCAEAGVLGVLPGVIGSLQATEALKIVLDIGETLNGRLLVYDALSMRFREIRFGTDSGADKIVALQEVGAACSNASLGAHGVEPFVRLNALHVRSRLHEGWDPFILDVRTLDEAAAVSLEVVHGRCPPDEVDVVLPAIASGREVLVVCRSGARAAVAARALCATLGGRVFTLDGGLLAWQAHGYPVTEGRAS